MTASPLREEFEPLLISTHGLHSRADICRIAWRRNEIIRELKTEAKR
jgi:hypothetical protein